MYVCRILYFNNNYFNFEKHMFRANFINNWIMHSIKLCTVLQLCNIMYRLRLTLRKKLMNLSVPKFHDSIPSSLLGKYLEK